MKRALGIALMALSITAPVSAETPYIEFLGHVGASSGEVMDVLESADGEAVIEWAEDEREWLLDNLPADCYVSVWGQWLSVVSITTAGGFSLEAGEPLTMGAIGEWLIEASRDFSVAVDAATIACVA